MSLNDYVKFITEQLVKRMNEPKQIRKKEKLERKAERLPLTSHTFGLIPLALSLLIKKKRKF